MPVPDQVEDWVCERCGEDKKPLFYLAASTPECYGRWYCPECHKICKGYCEKPTPAQLRENRWKSRKKNEH